MALAGVIPLSKGSVRERLAGQSLTGVIPLSKGALSKGQCVDTPFPCQKGTVSPGQVWQKPEKALHETIGLSKTTQVGLQRGRFDKNQD